MRRASMWSNHYMASGNLKHYWTGEGQMLLAKDGCWHLSVHQRLWWIYWLILPCRSPPLKKIIITRNSCLEIVYIDFLSSEPDSTRLAGAPVEGDHLSQFIQVQIREHQQLLWLVDQNSFCSREPPNQRDFWTMYIILSAFPCLHLRWCNCLISLLLNVWSQSSSAHWLVLHNINH